MFSTANQVAEVSFNGIGDNKIKIFSGDPANFSNAAAVAGEISLIGPDGTSLVTGSISDGIDNFTLPEDGMYKIRITPATGVTGALQLKALQSSPD